MESNPHTDSVVSADQHEDSIAGCDGTASHGTPPLENDADAAPSQTNEQQEEEPTHTAPPDTPDEEHEEARSACDTQPPKNDADQHEESELSAEDLLTLAVNFAVEFSLPWKAVEALQKLLVFVLKRRDLPVSKYSFKKSAGVTLEEAKFHFYCSECQTSVAETSGCLADRNGVRGKCSVCGEGYCGRKMLIDGHFFLSLPLERQIRVLLADEEVAAALCDRLENINQRNCSLEQMADITDGRAYRETRQKMSPNDLTLTLNSDGSPIFKSSKYSIWPVQVLVNELPVNLRHKNVLTAMLWFGQSHPDMTLLLNSFVQQMEPLADGGVTWKFGTEIMQSRIHCFSCCADAPARAIMQNMLQFNGHFGCGWCLHPGTVIDGTLRYTVDNPAPDRSTNQTIEQMKEAAATSKVIQGVKGPTALINLLHFDVVWGFTPDYMHCVLLGVTRQLTDLWLSTPKQPYYVGCPEKLQKIDKELCSVKPPLCIHRRQRSLSLRKFWKATEWQQWLVFFTAMPGWHFARKVP